MHWISRMQFGTNTVEFVSADSLKPGFQIIAQKTDIPGQVRIIASSLGAAGAITSSGDMIELKFKVKPVPGMDAATLGFTSFKVSNGAAQSFAVLQANPSIIQVAPSAK